MGDPAGPLSGHHRPRGQRGNEQGLLGLDFHPRYAENGFFYVNYTDRNGDTVIARFQVSPDDPNRADPGSEKRLLSSRPALSKPQWRAGGLWPGWLSVPGSGDGGSAGDPQGNGQSLDTLLGKILRIDVDNGDPYAIPPDNPFAAGGGRAEIWAYGLRNPWRFSFDRLTGDLYIGDVGRTRWKRSITCRPAHRAGRISAGTISRAFGLSRRAAAGLQFVPPVAEYSHAMGCSVTGGVVYRGSRLPAWQGVYLFGDYCSGTVWGLVRDAQGIWQNQALFSQVGLITSFGQDEQGEVYLVDQKGVSRMSWMRSKLSLVGGLIGLACLALSSCKPSLPGRRGAQAPALPAEPARGCFQAAHAAGAGDLRPRRPARKRTGRRPAIRRRPCCPPTGKT